MALEVVNEQAESPRVCVTHFTFGTSRAVDGQGRVWAALAGLGPH